ncbi:hypothetical protein ACS0TY_032301 [Phlomoides rotata]
MAIIISPNPDLQDLKITIQESGLVFPSQKTQKRTFFLSNIDFFLNFTVGAVHFFHSNPHFPPENVSPCLKTALQKVLVAYDFMAGRLAPNHRLSRYEIDCNSAGAGFVVASSHYSIQDMGDLASPNLGFRQLVPQSLNNDAADQPLCVFQVTSFECGGFAIGMSYNHMLLDGISAKVFIENLASQAFEEDKPLAVIPLHNRGLLAARTPPLVTFPPPEFMKLHDPFATVTVKEQLDVIVLKLSSREIDFLKAMAKATTDDPTSITTFNVVAALIWKCRALALHDIEQDKERAVTLLCVVDIRSRLKPALPREYCGNALITSYSPARCGDIGKAAFSEVVEMVSQGQERMSDEYVRSAIDWLEMNKGIPRGDIILSSWWKLGFDEVVFPWGKPTYYGPVMNPMERLCWMFSVDDDRVGVLIQRPPNEMERFRSHLLHFFGHN